MGFKNRRNSCRHFKFQILIGHVVEDPVHVVSDVGINARESFDSASGRSKADHSVLEVLSLARVYSRSLHRTATVSRTRIHPV